MAILYILAAFPTPIFVNETTTEQYALPGIYMNETVSAPTPPAGRGNHLPYLGVGANQPNAVDILISTTLFAGLLAQKNPAVNRRKLFTFGIAKDKPNG